MLDTKVNRSCHGGLMARPLFSALLTMQTGSIPFVAATRLLQGRALAAAGVYREMAQLPDEHLVDIGFVRPLHQEGHDLRQNLLARGGVTPGSGLNETSPLQLARATVHGGGSHAEALGDIGGRETLFP
jgi:hypothetical protein